MTFDLFICGVEKKACYRCGHEARKICTAIVSDPLSLSVRTCGRPLCDDHDRGERCAEHAPMTTNPNMPRPPGRR